MGEKQKISLDYSSPINEAVYRKNALWSDMIAAEDALAKYCFEGDNPLFYMFSVN